MAIFAQQGESQIETRTKVHRGGTKEIQILDKLSKYLDLAVPKA